MSVKFKKMLLALFLVCALTSCALTSHSPALTVDVLVNDKYRGKVVLSGEVDKIHGVTPAKDKNQLIDYKLNISAFEYDSENNTYVAFYDCQIELVENDVVIGISIGEINAITLNNGKPSKIECGYGLVFLVYYN